MANDKEEALSRKRCRFYSDHNPETLAKMHEVIAESGLSPRDYIECAIFQIKIPDEAKLLGQSDVQALQDFHANTQLLGHELHHAARLLETRESEEEAIKHIHQASLAVSALIARIVHKLQK